MRMDGRLEWADILMRMEYPGTSAADESKFRNRLQQRMARAREKFSMVAWRDTTGDNNSIRDRVLSKLTQAQLAARGGLGSTRGSTPGSRDSQGRVIPLPGRRPRGTLNATADTAVQQQQSQTAVAGAAPSNAASRQQNHIAYAGASASTSHQNQPAASNRSSRVNQQLARTNPVNGSRQDNQTSAHYGALPVRQDITYAGAPQAMFSRSHAGPSNGQYNQHGSYREGPLTREYIRSVTSHAGPSASQHNTAPSQDESSSEGGDGDDVDDGDYGCEEDDKSEDSADEEDEENDEDDGSDEPDAMMPLPKGDPRPAMLTAEERRELERYLEQDRTNILMYGNGKISEPRLLSSMARNEAEFRSGLKRARGDVSDDDEVDEMQSRRVKRTKRGGDAAGPSSQSLSETRVPGPWGEYNRQGALLNTSRRPATRPVGSAVERLHKDRTRQVAPKAMQNKIPEFPYDSQQDLVMDDEEYTVNSYQDQLLSYPAQPENGARNGSHRVNTGGWQAPNSQYPQPENVMVYSTYHTSAGEPQPRTDTGYHQSENGMGSSNSYTHAGETQARPFSHGQRQPGSERFSSALNSTAEQVIGDMPAHAPQDPVQPAPNGTPPAFRRAYQQPTASTIQDDPFFSDELFDGMLNGQPDANHVGSIYTRSQKDDIDQYYQRLMAPHPGAAPESNAQDNATPPQQHFSEEEPATMFVADLLNPYARPQAGQGGGAPQPYIPFNIPTAPAQGGNAPPAPQAPPRAPRPTEGPEMGLDIGNIVGWDPSWSEFVNDHDSEALLKAHYPDEFP